MAELSKYEELKRLIEKRMRVLIIGMHGIGKTEMCLSIASELNLKLLYFSTPTIDPWVDLVGVPIPKAKIIDGVSHSVIEFARREDLDECEWIMFDEINRGHPKAQNALFEVTQFGTINGIPLRNLKVVTAAINPPDVEMNYHVSELDPALLDRFHAYMEITADPIAEVYEKKGISTNVAKKVIAWWNGLPSQLKLIVTPRRLEYVMKAYENGFDINSCFLPSRMHASMKEIPIHALKETLAFKGEAGEVEEKLKIYSAEWINKNFDSAVKISNSDDAEVLMHSIKQMKIKDLATISHVLDKFNPEFQYSILEHFAPQIEKNLKKMTESYPDLVSWSSKTRVKMNTVAQAKA